jgi:hypothetical protein
MADRTRPRSRGEKFSVAIAGAAAVRAGAAALAAVVTGVGEWWGAAALFAVSAVVAGWPDRRPS